MTNEEIKEKIVEDVLNPLLSYYFESGKFEDADDYIDDIANKILELFASQKQELRENIKAIPCGGCEDYRDDLLALIK